MGSDLDLRIKNEEVAEWQSFKFFESLFPPGTLKQFRDSLDTARVVLEQVENFLGALEEVLAILALIEGLIKDFFGTFLIGILEDFRNIVNEAKSTGVYFLDLISPSWIGPRYFENQDYEGNPAIRAYINDNLTFELLNKTITYDEYKDDFFGNLKYFTYFKMQTYREFISMIKKAFLDEGDLPHPALSQLIHTSFHKPELSTNQKTMNEDAEHPWGLDCNYLRPGRPNFGNRGALKVFIVAVQLPDLLSFMRAIGTLSKLFYNAFIDHSEIQEFINKFLKHVKDFKNFSDWWKYTNNTDLSLSRGENPDFYGISLYQLFPFIFDIINNLIDALENLFRNIESSLTDILRDIIELIRQEIEEIRKIVRQIEELIDLIEDIINLAGASYVTFSTQDGIDGVIRSLDSLTKFPGTNQGERDRPRYIGGALVCYGYPQTDDENPNEFNLTDMWDARWKQVKENSNNFNTSFDKSKGNLTDSWLNIGGE